MYLTEEILSCLSQRFVSGAFYLDVGVKEGIGVVLGRLNIGSLEGIIDRIEGFSDGVRSGMTVLESYEEKKANWNLHDQFLPSYDNWFAGAIPCRSAMTTVGSRSVLFIGPSEADTGPGFYRRCEQLF